MTTINNIPPAAYTLSQIDSGLGIAGTDLFEAPPSQHRLDANVTVGSLSESAAAGEIAFSAASLNGLDWDAILNDVQTSGNLSVTMANIMTLMIEVYSQMRQNQREAALLDAQNALQAGLAASDQMKKAATMTLVSAIVTSSVSMASAGYSMKSASSQLKRTETAQAKFDKATAKPEDGGEVKQDVQNKAQRDFDADMSVIRSEGQTAQAKAQLGQSAGGIMSAVFAYMASSAQAEAQALNAQAEYEQSLAQQNQAFFQQLGDSMRAMLQSWKSVESAQHQSSEAIYNV